MPAEDNKTVLELSAEDLEHLPRFQQTLEEISTVFTKLDQLRTAPGTSLSADDRATPRDHLSHQFVSSLIHASDALNSIKIMVIDGGRIPVFAAHTLLRTALESIGMAFWLLGPRSRDTRALRSLQLSWEDHKDATKLMESYRPGSEPAGHQKQKTRKRFDEIRDSRPANIGKSLKAPSITARMQEAEQYINPATPNVITLEMLWRLTSGFAHNRRTTIYTTLEKEIIEEWDTGGTAQISSPLKILHPLCGIAHNYLLKAIHLFNSRNQTL